MRDFISMAKGDGTHAIDVSESLRGNGPSGYLVQFRVRDAASSVQVPTGGTVQIKGALKSNWPTEQIVASVDLTDRTTWLQQVDRYALATLEFVIASIETDHTVDIAVRALF